jgi:RES domain-containing protein
MKGELSLKVIRGKTGREGYHLKADHPTEHVEVQDFVSELCRSSNTDWNRLLETNETAQRIHRDFVGAIRTSIRGTYFRARSFPASTSQPTSQKLWAPPASKQAIGRYNELGNRVLYLSRNVQTVVAECPTTVEKPKLFIQKFLLNFPTRGMLPLELDLETNHPYLHYLLLDSEYVPEATAEFANVRNPYRATHFLAHLGRLNGVSGIEYPSIRGGIQSASNAVNLVLMDEAVGEAEAMTDGLPFLLSECDHGTG